jgi:hypothetical protein
LQRARLRLACGDQAGATADTLTALIMAVRCRTGWTEFAAREAQAGHTAVASRDWVTANEHFGLASLWHPGQSEYQRQYGITQGQLGLALLRRGDFSAARAALRHSQEVLHPSDAFHREVVRRLHECEGLLSLEIKLTNVLAGTMSPASPAEAIELTRVCRTSHHQRYAAAARFFAEAFAGDPKLADDVEHWYRYNAACCATLAACGQGKDAVTLGQPERARMRKLAHNWLRADMQHWTKMLEGGKPVDRAKVLFLMQHCQRDTDLAGVRDRKALATLPEAERRLWERLWADVAALLARAQQRH